MEIFSAEAPSNIALIKYMGKVAVEGACTPSRAESRPANSSLSYTLNHLRSAVTIEPSRSSADEWQPLTRDGWAAPDLSASSRERFLRHFQFLKAKWGIGGQFCIRSANNFPSDCGVASSASSFAALTQATHELARSIRPQLDVTRPQLADLSRQGSGSSIRSFFGPFAIWRMKPDGTQECAPWLAGLPSLHHQVVIVAGHKKPVSSSEAHKRVTTSLLYRSRPERAEERLQLVMRALGPDLHDGVSESGPVDWRAAYEAISIEFWDMHALFHTAQPPFQYMTASTLEVLHQVGDLWNRNGDGPLATLDAGPNIHLLYRPQQIDLAREFADRLKAGQSEINILSSYEMSGS